MHSLLTSMSFRDYDYTELYLHLLIKSHALLLKQRDKFTPRFYQMRNES